MKSTVAAAIALAVLHMSPSYAEQMQIWPNGSRPSTKGAAEYFTGSAIVNPFFGANAHVHSNGSLVTFEPGARSAWHTHPGGQMLIVVSGKGWIQEEGGPKREINPGDVIWTPPGIKHWHGATGTTSMSHIAITNVVNAKTVEWMQKVTDEEYRK